MKHILFFILTLSSINTISDELKPSAMMPEEPAYSSTFEVNIEKTDKHTNSQPIELTEKEFQKILYSMRIKNTMRIKNAPSIKLFNGNQIRDLSETLKSAFLKAGTNQKVIIKMITKPNKKDEEKKDTVKWDVVSLFFNDSGNLEVTYSYGGYEQVRYLEKGKDMILHQPNNDGTILKKYLEFKQELWTTHFNDPQFDVEINPDIVNVDNAVQKSLETQESTSEADSNQKASTITMEEMQKELDALQKMFDKGQITKEQYTKLKEQIYKKAGL